MGNTRPSSFLTALMAANFLLSVAALGGVVWLWQHPAPGGGPERGSGTGFALGIRPAGSGTIETTVALTGASTPGTAGTPAVAAADGGLQAGPGDAALPMAEQVDRLRKELAQMRESRDAVHKTVAELQDKVRQVEEKAGKGGMADMYAESAKQSARWQVAQLKKRLQLRADQLDPVKKLFEEQYTKMYADYYGQGEGGEEDLDYTVIAERQKKVNDEYEKKFEAMLDNWQVNEYRKLKDEQAQSMSTWGQGETQTESTEGQ